MPASRRRTLLRRGLFGLLVLELLYLVSVNLFLQEWAGPEWLRQRMERRQSKGPEITWRSGFSLVPGLVHLRGFELRGQTPRQRWHLQVDTLRSWVILPHLLQRRAVLSGTRGDGIEFALIRSEFDEFDEAAPKPASGSKRRPWKIDLRDVELTGIRDLNVLEQRYQGDGRLTGRLLFETPNPVVSSPRLHLRLEPGRLASRSIPAGLLDQLEAEVTIAPFRTREHRGPGILRFFSGRLQAEAERGDIGLLGYLFRHSGWLDLQGEGNLQLDLQIEQGRLGPDSHVHAWAAVDAHYLDFLVTGQARIRARVDRADPTSSEQEPEPNPEPKQGKSGGGDVESSLDITFDSFEVRQQHRTEPHAFGQGAVLEAHGPEIDLVNPATQWTIDLELPQAQVPDLTYYNAYLPQGSSLALRSGSGTVAADLRLDMVRADVGGRVRVAGQGGEIDLGDVVLEGDLTVDSKIHSGDPRQRRFEISDTHLRFDKGRFESDSLGSQGAPRADGLWWGEATLRDATLHLSPLSLDAAVDLYFRDTEPILRLVPQARHRPRWLWDLLTVEGVHGTGQLTYQESAVDLEAVDFQVGRRLRLLSELRLSRQAPQVLLFCQLGPLSVAAEQRGIHREWQLLRSRRWYEARRQAWRSTSP